MRRIHSISQTITTYGTQQQSRENLAKSSPFFFDERTDTVPIAMSSLSECQEIFDKHGKIVGFVSFDESQVVEGDLFCALISTLWDGAPASSSANMEEDMQLRPRQILAYALVLTQVESSSCISGSTWRRVGLTEPNYEWISNGISIITRII